MNISMFGGWKWCCHGNLRKVMRNSWILFPASPGRLLLPLWVWGFWGKAWKDEVWLGGFAVSCCGGGEGLVVLCSSSFGHHIPDQDLEQDCSGMLGSSWIPGAAEGSLAWCWDELWPGFCWVLLGHNFKNPIPQIITKKAPKQQQNTQLLFL